MMDEKTISKERQEILLHTLHQRFTNNMHRHRDMIWEDVLKRIASAPDKLWSLDQMEITGGEPDVVGYYADTGAFIFFDCAPESPSGRRSVCYDREGLDSRKEHKPQNSALDMAATMGIDVLTVDQYKSLQQLEAFDLKTSSWVMTPPDIRKLGGALFCDCRYGQVFVYHNGAQSYYGARGFRGGLRV